MSVVSRFRHRLHSVAPRILLYLAFALSALGTLAGLWFAYSAWQLRSSTAGMSAVALLLFSPPLACVAFLLRKESSKWEDQSRENLIIAGLARADSSLKAIRMGRGYICVLASNVVILGISQLMGMVGLPGFLTFDAIACAITAAVYLPWLARRERRVYEERAAARQLPG
jgi:hypothetical protein